MISPSSGKRPSAFLEKTFSPSTVISYTPPDPATNRTSASSPKACRSSSSSLEARGR